jgi:integrase
MRLDGGQAVEGWWNDHAPERLADWWADFARSLRRRGRTDTTIAVYERVFRRFWRWSITNKRGDKPEDIDYRTINDWTTSLQDDGLAPNSVVTSWRNLRPFFSWWAKEVGDDHVPAPNPFTSADTPSAPTTLIPIVSLEDLRKLIATCDGKSFEDRRDNAVLRVFIDCGIRLGELVGMRVGDWDRRADLLTVDGKTGPRVVPHSAATGEALARYMRVRGQHRHADLDALWLGTKGAWGSTGPQQMLRRRGDKAGLPRLHPHQFRHTWAHEAKAAGISEGDLMLLAGWKSPSMAQRYGSSAAAERAREAYQRLNLGDRL